MTTHTTTHAVLGMLHAHELLMMSVIRSLPAEMRSAIVEDFQGRVERSEHPHLSAQSERETLDSFRAHIRKLSILLASSS